MNRHSTGWNADDFADLPKPEPKDDDPWEMQSTHNEMVSDVTGNGQWAASQPVGPTLDKDAVSDFMVNGDVEDADGNDWDDDQFYGVERDDRESSAELATLLEWDEPQPGGVRLAKHDALNDMGLNGSYVDEPVPLAEYHSELAQPLHEMDHEIPNLSRAINVNQWVTAIKEISDSQLEEITELLLDFSQSRLRRWLPWLRGQLWTGQTLLLFLQVRAFWDDNPELWEASFWDSRFGCWRPTWSRYNLSLDAQFDLIQYRLDCSPSQVINRAWFDDWERFALWKYGYESFAVFALFRAVLTAPGDWRSHVDWHQSNDITESSPRYEDGRLNDSLTPQVYRMTRQEFWFASQDWYHPVEWHDGLGW